MIKKGYVLIIFFALFTAVSRTFRFRYYTSTDLSEMNALRVILHGLILFLIVLIPGLLLVHWYYKIKDKKKQ